MVNDLLVIDGKVYPIEREMTAEEATEAERERRELPPIEPSVEERLDEDEAAIIELAALVGG